jgi:hypothetical protein
MHIIYMRAIYARAREIKGVREHIAEVRSEPTGIYS